MSMLSSRCDELRMLAGELEQFTEGCIGRTREEHVMLISSVDCMREAADTITALSDKLQGVMGTRYCELFGTPERAARTVTALNACRVVGCEDCAARQLCMPYSEFVHDDYDALLEWLKGGSDGEHYEIDGFEVVFVPWHSDYMDEDFVAVTVLKEGREVMHAGMTHIEPSEASARKEVELMLMLRGDAV